MGWVVVVGVKWEWERDEKGFGKVGSFLSGPVVA